MINQMLERLLRRILETSKQGNSGTVDVYPLVGVFSLEIICQASFAQDISQNSDEDGFKFLKAMDDGLLTVLLDASLPFLPRSFLAKYAFGRVGHAYRQWDVWTETTRSLLRRYRAMHLDSKETTSHFIGSSFVSEVDTFLGRPLIEDEAMAESQGLLNAGSGTTSATLIYLLYHLAKPENRSKQDKLRAELEGCDLSLNAVKNLPYLNAVIKETLRLNPTIPSTLPRVLDTPLRVAKANIVLPKGTVVGMQNYIHQRNSDVFPQPLEYLPERWLDDAALSDMEKSLTPFGLGPTNCIGQNLAKVELLLATSYLFKKLDITLEPTMTEDDMFMEDRFAAAPKSRKLLLNVKAL
jgi:cytochrome P450